MSVLPKSVRAAVLARDGHRCHYCDEKLYPRARDSTLDHKIPRCRGGLDTLENLVASCGRCNNAKGDMTYELFLSIWQEALERGGGIKMVEAVCAIWKRKWAFTPAAAQWEAVLWGIV